MPLTFPLRKTGAIVNPEHIVCDGFVATTFGIGFTNTVAVIGMTIQPLAIGVIVKVTVIGLFVVFVNNPLIFPEPLVLIPVTVTPLFLVQLYVVPLALLLSIFVEIVAPEQIVCEDGVASALGMGLTNTVAVIGLPTQPLAIGVIVKVTVTGLFVILVNDPLIFPEPVPKIPVTVAELFLTQL